jgi:hypothetical protein
LVFKSLFQYFKKKISVGKKKEKKMKINENVVFITGKKTKIFLGY